LEKAPHRNRTYIAELQIQNFNH